MAVVRMGRRDRDDYERGVNEFVESVRRTLLDSADKDVEVEIDRGQTQREDWETQLMVYEPNGTMTITIKIDGGASERKGEPIGAPAPWWTAFPPEHTP